MGEHLYRDAEGAALERAARLAEENAELRAKLAEAQAAAGAEPGPRGVAAVLSESTTAPLRDARTPWYAYILVPVAAIAMFAVMLWHMSSGGGSPGELSAAPRARAAEPGKVWVEVRSTPPGVDVVRNGVVIGQTPAFVAVDSHSYGPCNRGACPPECPTCALKVCGGSHEDAQGARVGGSCYFPAKIALRRPGRIDVELELTGADTLVRRALD